MTDTIDLLASLVAFDTTSARSNLDLIQWVDAYLAGSGIEAAVLPDETGRKASLVARIGPDAPGGIVLCGHSDVVPVADQCWTRDPFAVTVDGSRLYGRGTADMKGFIASALAAVPLLTSAELATPVVLAITYDEEVGCLGAPQLAAHLRGMATPAAVIVGEPTEMQVVRAHKGIRALRTTINGRAAHSSRPAEGASATIAAARLAVFIDDLAQRLATDGVRAAGFEPPHTTMNVGTIAGGSALNIVAPTASVVWEYRWVPGEDVAAIAAEVQRVIDEHLVPDLRATARDAMVTTDVLADVPALDPASNAAAADLVAALADLGSGPPLAFATDGAVLQSAGLPVVVCGPGSMAQGHQPDEYIERAQLRRCDELMQRIGTWAAQPQEVAP